MKSKITKMILVVLAVIACGLLLYKAFGTMLPGLIPVLKSGNEKDIQTYLEQAGKWDGMSCVLLLQFMQVVSIVMPGTPIQIASGIVYGIVRAFILCFLGYWTANMAVFLVVRHLRKIRPDKEFGKTIEKRFGKNGKGGWLSQKVSSTHPAFAVMLGCLMPGVPNGIIPYIAAGTEIGCRQFAVAVAGGCAVPIFTSCLAGHFILAGDYLFSVLSMCCSALTIFIVIKNQDKVMKVLDHNRIKPDQTDIANKENGAIDQ